MRTMLLKAKHFIDLLFAGFIETIDLILQSSLLKLLSSMSIRYKIACIITTVLTLTVFSLGYLTFTQQTLILHQEMQKRAEVLVHQLAAAGKEGILTKQELHVFSTITEIQKKTGVVYAMILDARGTIFIHNELSMKGKVLTDKTDQMSLNTDALLFQEIKYDGQPVLDATYPIIYKPRNIRVGFAKIGLSEKDLLATIAEQKKKFFWVSFAFVIIGVFLSFSLARILTKSIYTLEEGMQRVTMGDLSRQVPVSDKDEIGRLTEAFNQMTLSLREKLHMEKYLSRSTVKSIKKNRDRSQLKLGGIKKHVTTLFSDVRGFTSLSEKMSPEEVVALLNVYLNLQGKVIRRWGGVVDKFIGDEVMAIFEGAEADLNAARSAVEIQRYCQSLNWARGKTGQKQLHIGIGLNSGEVIMGNMGSVEQMDYTVIGDNVNIAARLCSIALPGQIVISKVIADQIAEKASIERLEPVTLKGKAIPLDIYSVIDIKGLTRKYMRQSVEASVIFHPVGIPHDKSRAVAKYLSPSGCLMEVTSPVDVGSKLCLLIDHRRFENLNIVATVHRIRKQNSKYYIGMIFNELDDASKCSIISWVHEVESDVVDSVLAT